MLWWFGIGSAMASPALIHSWELDRACRWHLWGSNVWCCRSFFCVNCQLSVTYMYLSKPCFNSYKTKASGEEVLQRAVHTHSCDTSRAFHSGLSVLFTRHQKYEPASPWKWQDRNSDGWLYYSLFNFSFSSGNSHNHLLRVICLDSFV